MPAAPEDTIIFDQYSRYRFCAELVASASGGPCTVLDVGSGGECSLALFLPGYDLSFIDPLLILNPGGCPGAIPADFLAHDFAGQQFDYLLSIDTLEHVPPVQREPFLRKMISLAAHGIVLACPCSDEGDAVGTDRYLSDAFRERSGIEYPWLAEHAHYGLPSLKSILTEFRTAGFATMVMGHGHAPWLRKLLLYTITGLEVPSEHGRIMALSGKFNRELYPFDTITPVYRQVILARKTPGHAVTERKIPKLTPEAAAAWESILKSISDTIHTGFRDVVAVQQELRESVISARLILERLNRVQAEYESTSAWAHRAAEDVRQRDETIMALNRQIQDASADIRRQSDVLADRNARILELESGLRALSESASRPAAIITERELQISELRRQLETLRQELDASTSALSDRESAVRDLTLATQRLAEEIAGRESVIRQLKADEEVAADRAMKFEAEIRSLNTVVAEGKIREKDLLQDIAVLKDAVAAGKAASERLTSNIAELKGEIGELHSRVDAGHRIIIMCTVLLGILSDAYERTAVGLNTARAEGEKARERSEVTIGDLTSKLDVVSAERTAIDVQYQALLARTRRIGALLGMLIRTVELAVSARIPQSIRNRIGPLYRRLVVSRFEPTVMRPVIDRLHPPVVAPGEPFNLQPNGKSALTVTGRYFTHTSRLFVNGRMLPTDFAGPEALSACIPDDLCRKAGEVSVEVRIPGVIASEPRQLIVRSSDGTAEIPIADSPDHKIRREFDSRYGGAARKPDIICFPITYWNFRFQRTGQILRRLAGRGHRVFYINTEFLAPETTTPATAARISYTLLEENITQVTLTSPRPLNIYRDHLTAADADGLIASLGKLVQERGISRAVSFVCFPFWSHAAIRFSEAHGFPLVYDCMDDHSGFGNISDAILGEESDLMKRADLTLFTSAYLWDKYHAATPNPCMVRNAADIEHFSKPAPNNRLADLRHPVIGYYGAIAEWFDTALIKTVAEQKPGWTFLLVGHTFGADLTALQKLPNVRFTGEVPYDVLPEYVHHFDVCTIPFIISDLIRATNPVKFYEYMSTGKPIVATRIPELEPYRKYAALVDTPAQFIAAVEAGLTEPASLKSGRKEIARRNTWDERTETLEGALAPIVDRRNAVLRDAWKQFRITVLILTHKGREFLPACCESLRRQTHPNLELLLVDNASVDDGPAYVKAHFPEIRVLHTGKNLGFSAGNNWGVPHATGEAILFLNDDTELAPDTIEQMAKIMVLDPRIGGVGGTVLSLTDKEKFVFTLPKIDPITSWVPWINQSSPIRRVDYLAGNSMLLRRSALDEVGLLDPRFFAYFEETDLCARIFRAGYDLVYTPYARIWHKEMGFWSLDKNYYYMNRNRYRFAMRNFDRGFLPGFLRHYAAHLLNEACQNLRERRGKRLYLLIRGIVWNLVFTPEILLSRYRAGRRIRSPRSFNRELPLRNLSAPGNGTYSE